MDNRRTSTRKEMNKIVKILKPKQKLLLRQLMLLKDSVMRELRNTGLTTDPESPVTWMVTRW